MSTIYVLRLNRGKFYIGKTDNLKRRLEEHLCGGGSSWTSKYKVDKVEKIVENASPFDEDKYVKEYMSRYGIDNVRGGSYVYEHLDDSQKKSLRCEIWGATDRCTRCGNKGHFVKDCHATVDVEGNELCSESEYSDSDAEYDSEYESESESEYYDTRYPKSYYKHNYAASYSTCYRCGRSGHYANNCYAKI